MISDLRKSINSILYQRVTSPLFGTFTFAWLVWNWKILYTTFFIDEDKIDKNKIDYIVENFSDPKFLIWYPLLSTLILLTVIPFISNGAYWLSLKFEKWRVDNKNAIEKKQLLTLEQSIQLREQIIDSERKFDSLLQNKNDEIKQLKGIIEQMESVKKSETDFNDKGSKTEDEEQEIIGIFNKVKENPKLKTARNTINFFIQGGYSGLSKDENINSQILSYFESNDLIQHLGKGMYEWTEKGKRLNQLINDLEFE
ncbi:hypothetical protein ACPX19_13990 [Winogradskyella sp. HB-48]|uniref:hypothetical protein n=1 Tax=Winogradskyella sp. HB-48 TaxID=3416808 RepID=UPI003CEA6EAC